MSQGTAVGLSANVRYKPDGRKAYLKALRKWKFDPPEDSLVFIDHRFKMMMARTEDGQNLGEVAAESTDEDVYYLSPVYIGEGDKKQMVMLDFDTGSSDLWVFTKKALSLNHTGTIHHSYDPDASPTMKPLATTPKSTFRIDYADGSWAKGDVVLDTVNLGDILVEGQAIEIATSASSQMFNSKMDGLLGLAFGTLNGVKPNKVKTPVENMIAQGDIKGIDRLFTCKLTRYTEAPGFYSFGYIDKTVTPGQKIHYANVIGDSWWTYASETFTIGDEVVSVPGNVAIPDTGTTLALVSDAVCNKIYGKIPGAKMDRREGGWVFPSNVDVKSLPKIGLAVGKKGEADGEKIFYIAPTDLAYAPAAPGWIFGGIQSKGSMKEDLLGDIFLKNLYCVFDAGKKQFGCTQREPVFIRPPPSFLTKGVVKGSVTDEAGVDEDTTEEPTPDEVAAEAPAPTPAPTSAAAPATVSAPVPTAAPSPTLTH